MRFKRQGLESRNLRLVTGYFKFVLSYNGYLQTSTPPRVRFVIPFINVWMLFYSLFNIPLYSLRQAKSFSFQVEGGSNSLSSTPSSISTSCCTAAASFSVLGPSLDQNSQDICCTAVVMHDPVILSVVFQMMGECVP